MHIIIQIEQPSSISVNTFATRVDARIFKLKHVLSVIIENFFTIKVFTVLLHLNKRQDNVLPIATVVPPHPLLLTRLTRHWTEKKELTK